MNDDIYRQYILDIFRNMKNKREISNPSKKLQGFNASCGDRLVIYISTDKNNIITDMSFTGDGCLLSQVSAEILSEHVKGKDISELKELSTEELMDIIGIHPSITRIKCMELSLQTTKKMVI